MGAKHSVNLQHQKDSLERVNLNLDQNSLFANSGPFQQNAPGPFGNFNNRQNVPYNFGNIPPKPPRQNPDILMTGGASSNRSMQPSFRISPTNEDSNKNKLNYRKQENISNDSRRSPTQTNQAPNKHKLLQELLECPICMNLFDNPLVLPCQHTFCKKCIISLQQNDTTNRNNTIDCPICREKHKLQNGIEGLSANYTMKRLIELESMSAAEKEKEKNKEKSKAKCFGCQKYAYLKVCHDCSYMLCVECTENPDHDIIIESKINAKRQQISAIKSLNLTTRSRYPQMEYTSRSYRHDMYADHKAENPTKLKLILLCHSSAVEVALENNAATNEGEVLEDEYGKCKTFHKIGISINDRVITLKKIVEKKFGILCKDQILVYKDKILKSDLKPLSYYNIRQFSRVHVFDERDIKENSTDVEEDLYGIYQDTNVMQGVELAKKKLIPNTSSSSSSQTDSGHEGLYRKNKYKNSAYDSASEVKMMQGHFDTTKRSSSVAVPQRNYYSLQNKYSTMSRYRKLDEIFDHSMNIKDY